MRFCSSLFLGAATVVIAGSAYASGLCDDFYARLPSVQRVQCEDAKLQPSAARSVKGRSIYTRDVNPQDARLRVLVIGGIHGDELSSASVALHWIGLAQAAPQQTHWRFIPALNPDGLFSRPSRRVNANGVDLNRNFVDFHQRPLPANPGYEELASALLPRQWPPSAENEARLSDYIVQHGRAAWQQAVSGGQYTQELGLFYGGHTPTWSHVTLRHVLEDHLAGVRELAWIDLHTGLGPCGHGERIYTGQDTGESLTRARHWWGAGVTSLSEGNSSSAPLVGLMWSIVEPVFAQVAPGARYTGMALEFGTVPLDEMIMALRADHWLEAHPEAPPEQAQAIKRQIRDAFYIDTPAWKTQLLAQASEAAHQALAGLNSSSPFSYSPT